MPLDAATTGQKDFKEPTSFQKFFIYREEFRLSSNVSVTAKFNEPIFSRDNSGNIQSVARFLVTKYPILRSNIFNRHENKDFDYIIKPVNLDFVTSKLTKFIIYNSNELEQTQLFENPTKSITDETYFEALGDYVFEQNDSSNILWRLFIIDDYTATFCYDHCLLDGMSGFNFFHEFQEIYESLIIDSEKLIPEKYHNSYKEFIFSSFEVFNIHKIRLSVLLKNLFLYSIAKKSKIIQRILIYFCGPDCIPVDISLLDDTYSEKVEKTSTLNTGIVSINIPADKLSKLLIACKKNQVKTSIWMLGALQLTLKDYLKASGNQNKKLACGVPINIREYIRKKSMISPINASDLKFGLFIGHQELNFHPTLEKSNHEDKTEVLVDVIRNSNIIRNDIHNSFIHARESVGMLNYVDSFYSFFQGRLKNLKTSYFMESSNLGMFKNNTEQLKVEDVYFTSSNNIVGSMVTIYSISTELGGCNLSFCMNKGKKSEIGSIIRSDYATNLLSIIE